MTQTELDRMIAGCDEIESRAAALDARLADLERDLSELRAEVAAGVREWDGQTRLRAVAELESAA